MAFRVYHPSDLYSHRSKPDHPERPHRIAAVLEGVAAMQHPAVSFHAPVRAPLDAARLLHDDRYIDDLARPFSPGEPARKLDGGDTHQSHDSLHAALDVVGSLQDAVDQVATSDIDGALVAIRPAGHHACADRAMGFCLLGSAALAAKHAEVTYGFRVAVLDFDVHHGNGTENLLWDQPNIFFASTHEQGQWPQTGAMESRGAHGQIMNRPLPKGSSGLNARAAWGEIFDAVRAFQPDMIIVSAGFDAHTNDPLGGLNWTCDDFAWLGTELSALAQEVSNGRIVTLLEGGYDLEVLRHCVPLYLEPFLARSEPEIEASKSLPALKGASQGATPSPYLAASAPLGAQSDQTYACVKSHGRLWIQNLKNGALLYTPPGFLRLTSRDPLIEFADQLNANGFFDIEDVITFEASCARGFGYSKRVIPVGQ